MSKRDKLRAMIAGVDWPAGLSLAAMLLIARYESSHDPRTRTGKHRGPWQLSPESVEDYNRDAGTSLSADDLHDVAKSLPVVLHHFRRVVLALRAAGADYTSWDFVPLVYAAHNMGWSTRAGLAALVKREPGLTVAGIADAVERSGDGLTRHLSNPKKQAYLLRFAREWHLQHAGADADSDVSRETGGKK